MKGHLILEDGTYLEAEAFGAEGVSGGELVFNTAMTGYQEMLTDPSYCGQILTLTYPLIGSYGVNAADTESKKIFAAGMVVGDYVDAHSNFRATQSLARYLKGQGIVGIHQVDTRYLTRKIREKGAMRAIVAAGEYEADDLRRRLEALPSMEGANLVARVAATERYEWREGAGGSGPHVVVVDCGVKYNILRMLAREGCRVTVVPPSKPFAKIRELSPDGLLLSNGPGDPAAVTEVVALAQAALGQYPILGICLGHQILGLAAGAKTYKLKFGHHGANHPVQQTATGRIEITSQNHGFAVDGDTLAKVAASRYGKVRVSHVHLSDGTIEGFELPDVAATAIQYHPEAAPGPHDSSFLFKEFVACTTKKSPRK